MLNHTGRLTQLTSELRTGLLAVQPAVDGRYLKVSTTEFTYTKDQEIHGDDEPATYVYEVVRGAVRTYKLLSDGRRQIGAFLLPGDVFGLGSSARHKMNAEAIVETKVRLLKRSSLEALALSDVAVANRLWMMTASELRHAENHMILLGRKTAIERVASFLLEMDKRFTTAGMLALPMSRRDIGDYLGLTLETVSRVLSQLNSEGAVAFSNARQIVIKNRSRLASLNA